MRVGNYSESLITHIKAWTRVAITYLHLRICSSKFCCCNSSWTPAFGWRNIFKQVDDMWCLQKKLEQALFPSKQDFSFSHFSATIHMDPGVSAWVDRMWISHPEFTSSDGYQWTGNSSTAISYAVHHCVRHSAHAVFFTEMNVCSWLVFCKCVNTHPESFSALTVQWK